MILVALLLKSRVTHFPAIFSFYQEISNSGFPAAVDGMVTVLLSVIRSDGIDLHEHFGLGHRQGKGTGSFHPAIKLFVIVISVLNNSTGRLLFFTVVLGFRVEISRL